MKYLLLLPAVLCLNLLNGQTRPVLHDPSLTKLILEKIICPDAGLPNLEILTEVSSRHKNYLITHKPDALWRNIKAVFKVSDPGIVRMLLDHSHFLDTTIKIAAGKKVSYLKRDDSSIVKYAEEAKAAIILNLYLLYHKNNQKCIVYYESFREGGYAATLEKKNTVWVLIKKETVYLE